ncbi:MAG: hypothetical protein R3C53_06375 [Pirellulaceae bacterium]
MRLRTTLIFLALCTLILNSWLLAQEGATSTDQSSIAGGLRFRTFSKAFHSKPFPGAWLILRAHISNTGDRPQEGTLVVTAANVPDLPSARTLVFEAGREEYVDVYVRVPQSLNAGEAVDFTMTLVRREGDRDIVMDLNGQPMQHSLRVAIADAPDTVLSLLEEEPARKQYWMWPGAEPHYNNHFVVAGRVAAGNSRATTSILPGTVPLNKADWQGVSMAVVSDPAQLEDATAVEALKRYVNDGGRLWIMLDDIPNFSVRPLLASGQFCEVLDEVELNSIQIALADNPQNISQADLHVSLDRPARLKRVYQEGGTVSHFAEGWPAAIWMNVGYGQVLITTLESHAWITAGTESTDAQRQTDFKNRLWALSLSTAVNEAAMEQPLSASTNYPMEFIGSPVLPRRIVASALAGFLALLVIGGAFLAKVGEIRRIGWIAPLIALLTASGLFIGSRWIRRDKAETAAALQLVQISADGQVALVREQGAMFLESQRDMQLSSQSDGFAMADSSVQSGIRRFEVGDFQNWQLHNTAWPPGTWRYRAEGVLATQSMQALAQLYSDGVHIALPEIQLPNMEAAEQFELEDPVVSFIPGTAMVGKVSGASAVHADGSMLAEGDRWIAGTLISDEQQRRLEVYQQFFRQDDRVPLLSRVVYGWTPRWEASQWTGEGFAKPGSALVSLPIRLVPPKLGESVLVPSGLVALRRDISKQSRTSVYSERTGKWKSEISLGIKSDLQFVLPSEILPFEAESITLELDIKAPHRTVLLQATGGGQSLEVVKLDGPSIPWRAELTDPQILADARDGVLDFHLEVGDRNDVQPGAASTTVVTWQIDGFRASLRGSRSPE